MHRFVMLSILLLLHIIFIGCAVGNIGTLAAKVQYLAGAHSIELHALGLHVRTRADDAGAQFGYSIRRYVFLDSAKVEDGWYFFRVPLPDMESTAQDLKTFGIEASTVAPEAGISIGYQHTVLYARVQPWASFYLQYQGSASNLIRIRRN